MKNQYKIIYFFISLILLFLICSTLVKSQGIGNHKANDYTINLARAFTKEIFDLNGTEYLQPLVISLNATSNSRFFNSGYVPKRVDKPYFRFSINSMVGIIGNDQKSYVPTLPHEPLDLNKLNKLVTIDFLSDPQNPKVTAIPDTSALILYAFKIYIDQGLQSGAIKAPASSATILGSQNTIFYLPKKVMDSLIRSYPNIGGKLLYDMLPQSLKDILTNSINQFPEYLTLPPGTNMNTLFAFVPQLEVGSIWGTEMLIRLVPPVDLGTNIGKFAFWGIGLKHSISQYFDDLPVDVAVQAVGQGTRLKNFIGLTNSELTANATIWDINIQASKTFFDDILTVFGGISHEWIYISSSYKYYLPVETQLKLGLVDEEVIGYFPGANGGPFYRILPNSKDYPGDTIPQYSNINLSDRNFTAVLGLSARLGPISLTLDYNYSKFSIMTGSITYWF